MDRGGLLFIAVLHVERNIAKLIKCPWKTNSDIYDQAHVIFL